MKLIVVFTMTIGLLLTSCGVTKKIETLKPDIHPSLPVTEVNNQSSFVHLPVNIQISDIERFTNSIYKELIYNDQNIEDDNLKWQVWKSAPITMTFQKGKLKTVLPLKTKLVYRITTKKLGLNLFDDQEFNGHATVTLLSDVGLTNWELKTKTTLVALEWKEEPTLKVFNKNVPITNIINPALGLFNKTIEQGIDSALKESLNFKPHILETLESITKPILMSETYESWLRIVPQELYTTDAIIHKDEIQFTMGLKCFIETHIGSQPKHGFDSDKIKLKPVSHIPNQVETTVVVITPYKEASRLLTKNFKGETFGSGKKKIKVNEVEVWQNNQKMIVSLDVSGAVNGKLYLSGFPQFNEVTREVYFDQLDYVLDTKNVLTRTANFLASNYILKQLQENCRYSIDDNMKEIEQNIKKYITDFSPLKGVEIKGKLNQFTFDKIQLIEDSILCFIKINGEASIFVNGIE